jgi:predicted Zn-dependent peptidase
VSLARTAGRRLFSALRFVVMHVQSALGAAIAGAILVLVSSRPASADGWSAPIERYELTNGLRVVLAPDDSLPDVSVRVTYDAGSADDPDRLEGLAHLVEHVAFAGSRDVGPGDHAHLLALAGATGVGGSTGPDVTNYFETVPPEGLERALWLEADRMGFQRDFVQGTIVERERTIVGHEHHLRTSDSVWGTLDAFAWDEIFPGWHPYHLPSDGLSAIARADVSDVRAFLRTWYVPGNATLVLAGHFESARAKALVEKHFGRLPAGSTPRRQPLPAVPVPGNLWIEIEAPIVSDYAEMYWATPARGDPGDRALDLAVRLLAGPGGWLTKKLADGGGPALAIDVKQTSMRRGSAFRVEVFPAAGAGLSGLLLAVQSEMASFAAHLTAADVDAAKAWIRQSRLLNLEGSGRRASTLSLEGSWGLDDYQGIDAAAVADAVRRYLDPVHRVTMVVRVGYSFLPPGVRGLLTHRERMTK